MGMYYQRLSILEGFFVGNEQDFLGLAIINGQSSSGVSLLAKLILDFQQLFLRKCVIIIR